MFLACPQCDVHYKLDDLALGPAGRKVRCTSCGYVWHAMLPEEAEPPPPPVPGPFTNTEALAEEDMSISFDGDSAETSYDPSAYDEPITGNEELPRVDLDALGDWPDVTVEEAPATVIPDVVKPFEGAHGEDMPHYQAAGTSANAFGFAVFLLPLLLTAVLLVALRGPLVTALPALAPLYRTVGLAVHPPGEGLRLSTLVAERRIDKDVKTLALSAMLANASPVAHSYPPLEAVVSGPYGTVLKTWNLPAPAGKTLASGEESPIKVEFKDVPDAAAVVSLKVRKE